MKHLGAREAADAIRDQANLDKSSRLDPEQAHAIKFVKEVCHHLGLEQTPENVHHVELLLREHGIAMHQGHEYPKHVTRKWDGTTHVVHSQEEEDAKINEPERNENNQLHGHDTLLGSQPVQDLSLNLVNQVPKIVPPEHPTGRVPEHLTDREAGQGQRLDLVQHHDEHDDGSEDHSGDADDFSDDADDFGTGSDDTEDHTNFAGAGLPVDDHSKGIQAHDDADRDGAAGQDADPTHDNGFVRHAADNGTLNQPRPHSDEVSTDEAARAAARQPANRKRPK